MVKIAMKVTKKIGSAKARKQVRQITKRVLTHKGAHKMTPIEAAEVLGLQPNDVRNMRNKKARNSFSMPMLCRMVKNGFCAHSIVYGPELSRPHGKAKATQAAINKRIRKLAKASPGKVIAATTGLSLTGAYGLRYSEKADVTLYTVLGFLNAGHTVDELILGKR